MINSFNLPPVLLLTVQNVELDRTENQQTENIKNVMTARNHGQEMEYVTRTLAPEKLSETPILVATNVKDITQLDAFDPFEQEYP